MAGKAEKKNNTRSRIITYVMNNRSTSKVELSKKPEYEYADCAVQRK